MDAATPAIIQKAQGYKSIFQDFQTRAKNITDFDTTSPETVVKNYIKDAEGHKGYIYQDVGGKDHIGYGHLITDEEKRLGTFAAYTRDSGNRLSQAEQERLFEGDYSLKKGQARSNYGNREFDRLSHSRQALLVDYSYMGITKKRGGGGPTKLLTKIKKGLADDFILEEAQDFSLKDREGNVVEPGTSNRKRKQAAMFNKLISNNSSEHYPIRNMLLVMDQFHKGESKKILNTLYPSVKADRQINAWKSELDKFKNKLESNNFTEDDLFKLEGIIAHQFRETIGGLN